MAGVVVASAELAVTVAELEGGEGVKVAADGAIVAVGCGVAVESPPQETNSRMHSMPSEELIVWNRRDRGLLRMVIPSMDKFYCSYKPGTVKLCTSSLSYCSFASTGKSKASYNSH